MDERIPGGTSDPQRYSEILGRAWQSNGQWDPAVLAPRDKLAI